MSTGSPLTLQAPTLAGFLSEGGTHAAYDRYMQTDRQRRSQRLKRSQKKRLANVDGLVHRLAHAADKWCRGGHNWVKIFASIDEDGSGMLSYAELRQVVRSRLKVSSREVSERELRSLWGRLDADRSGSVGADEFDTFMRAHGPGHRGGDGGDGGDPAEDLEVDLVDVLARLRDALLLHGKKSGVHCRSWSRGWKRLFERALGNADGSGRMDYGTLRDVVFDELEASVSVQELHVLFDAIDADGSGEVTAAELQRFMHSAEMASWPTPTPEGIERCVAAMSAAAVKWHGGSGGNWFKIFRIFDTDDSGQMDFEELQTVIRATFPGLSIDPETVSESDVQMLWKAVDADGDATIAVAEFMAFMKRKSGISHTKQTEYSKQFQAKKAAEARAAQGLPPLETGPIRRCATPEVTAGLVIEAANGIHAALVGYLEARGIHHGWDKNFDRIFEKFDTDGSGMIDYEELRAVVLDELHADLTEESVLGLWMALDSDASGAVNKGEFVSLLHRAEIAQWPDPDDQLLVDVVEKMNDAADKWHNAGGNFYKVFRKFDTDNSGVIDFPELSSLVRASFPGLNIPKREVSDNALKAFWKGMDADGSSDVTVAEFMRFMRHHGSPFSLHKPTEYSKQQRQQRPVLGER
jgi:Ca2+-binding EF-hand superfamily protein